MILLFNNFLHTLQYGWAGGVFLGFSGWGGGEGGLWLEWCRHRIL